MTEFAVFRTTTGPFGILSNMARGMPVAVTEAETGDIICEAPSSEHVYQCLKFCHLPAAQHAIMNEAHPVKSKRNQAAVFMSQARADWRDVSVAAMRWTITLKAMRHPDLIRDALASTGTRPIIEHSTRDGFWGASPGPRTNDGCDTWIGTNMLGRLWTELRDDIMGGVGVPAELPPPEGFGAFRLFGRDIGVQRPLTAAGNRA